MKNKIIIFKIFVIMFFILSIKSTNSENSTHLLVFIDNQIITNIDVENEKNYLLTVNKNLNTLDNKEMLNIAKNSLIREKIKKNELEKYFDLSENSKYMENLLKDFYTRLEFTNLEDLENYFLSRNVELKTVKEKLNIEALWNELIYERYGSQVAVDEKKLKAKIDATNYKNEKELFLLSEIVFEATNKDEVETGYKKILESIGSIGFGNTANIYSISKSAQFNGKIGWINTSQVQANIYSKIKDLEDGEYSDLISVPGGFLILNLIERKKEIIEINEKEELKRLITYERDRQFNEFSAVYFQKIKKNSLINEK